MEGIHGVDVSWLHHPNRDHQQRNHAPTSPGLSRDSPPKTSSQGSLPPLPLRDNAQVKNTTNTTPRPQNDIPPPSPNPQAPAAGSAPRVQSKRPSMLSRGNSEKGSAHAPDKLPRRTSWISSISAKFSPAASPNEPGLNGANGQLPIPSSPTPGANGASKESPEPTLSQSPKAGASSFFSNALRRLSTGTQTSGGGKLIPNGGMCPRKVLNVDPNRERCVMPELNNAKLRRVAFCVDVEIAGGPRYKDEEDDKVEKKKFADKKLKERAEGEALKHPEAVVQQKETDGAVQEIDEAVRVTEGPVSESIPPPTEERKDSKDSKKKEKKKRSEAERKERKEKKRRKAVENGQIPLEITQDDSSGMSTPTEMTTVKPQARPTTDPLRIYRRCCQLRETPILKRITDQLSTNSNSAAQESAIVSSLDLTGSRLQLADVVTLSDWLAIVPVRRLLLEDADLSDEAVRVILAGLLAAKTPSLPKQRNHSPTRKSNIQLGGKRFEERSGFVEKISLKNNPKITKEGWKHISLFIYMCRSLRAIDVSMIPFTRIHKKRSNSVAAHNVAAEQRASHADLAEIFCKAIAERLGGSRLEELIMAECALGTEDVRKIVDGVTYSGLKRLSLAGNNLDDNALEHVLRYMRSGVCDGLDIGGNDLRHRLGKLASAFTKECSLWALSLADCNLSPDSLKPLLPALAALSHFRFLDLSHNQELFSTDPSALTILRKYLPQFQNLKRVHLSNVSMSPAQAIGLAEVLPEVPHLAHLNLLDNPQLSALAQATDEASQEEACALYASLMCAARASKSMICIDIDVPGQETSEIVKALAKQVVAYCLRNMEAWTAADVAEASEQIIPTELNHAGKEVKVPDVLLHLVGHSEGMPDNGEEIEPAPDDDYIMGGTGVVKALSYCLSEKASDHRRASVPTSGASTPRNSAKEYATGAKARNMSKDLLESARKIRARLQPILVRESKGSDEMAYKRLLFLDSTLQGIIKRFEDEYPDTRVSETTVHEDDISEKSSPPVSLTDVKADTNATDPVADDSDSDDARHSPLISRHNSDVSLASRALGIEEGHIHRLGQKVRRDIFMNTSPAQPTAHESNMEGSEKPHLTALRAKFAAIPGEELLRNVQAQGWDETVKSIGLVAEELKKLEEENPDEFLKFKEAQLAALENAGRERDAAAIRSRGADVAVEE